MGRLISENLASISAGAVTPDQLIPYVSAVSDLQSKRCGDSVLHYGSGYGVLVAYCRKSDPQQLDSTVLQAMEFSGIRNLTVLAPIRPSIAPQTAKVVRDNYWAIDLPALSGNPKLRNILKRSARDVTVEIGNGASSWKEEHSSLVADFCKRKSGRLDDGTVYIFNKLGAYLANAPQALLFSARMFDGKLVACAIGDFTALSTAFYMFAFRAGNAPPGTADLLLNSISMEGAKRGHTKLNLGLGIDSGIEFFKKKWGASPHLPYVETSWDIARPAKSWFARLFNLKPKTCD